MVSGALPCSVPVLVCEPLDASVSSPFSSQPQHHEGNSQESAARHQAMKESGHLRGDSGGVTGSVYRSFIERNTMGWDMPFKERIGWAATLIDQSEFDA